MPKTFLPELLNFTRAKRSETPMAPDEFRKIRKAARMTQTQMAQQLGVTRLTICNWEGARFRIPDDVMDRLAEKGIGVPVATKASVALIRATVEAYREMRSSPNNFSHVYIITMWRDRGFTPSPAAQVLIAESFPDILSTPNPEK